MFGCVIATASFLVASINPCFTRSCHLARINTGTHTLHVSTKDPFAGGHVLGQTLSEPVYVSGLVWCASETI